MTLVKLKDANIIDIDCETVVVNRAAYHDFEFELEHGMTVFLSSVHYRRAFNPHGFDEAAGVLVPLINAKDKYSETTLADFIKNLMVSEGVVSLEISTNKDGVNNWGIIARVGYNDLKDYIPDQIEMLSKEWNLNSQFSYEDIADFDVIITNPKSDQFAKTSTLDEFLSQILD